MPYIDYHTDRLIRHYVQHGDAGCGKCNDGFNAYWVRKP